jgi:hypothetical protein
MADFTKYMDFYIKLLENFDANERHQLIAIWRVIEPQIENDYNHIQRILNNDILGRKAFYRWVDKNYTIIGNTKTGKLIRFNSRKAVEI